MAPTVVYARDTVVSVAKMDSPLSKTYISSFSPSKLVIFHESSSKMALTVVSVRDTVFSITKMDSPSSTTYILSFFPSKLVKFCFGAHSAQALDADAHQDVQSCHARYQEF